MTTQSDDEALASERECTLITRGRTSREPRAIAIWFAAVGRTVYLLSGGGDAAHWVRNLRAEPAVELVVGGHRLAGIARVVAGDVDDPVAREAIASKYGTRGLETWLRTSLPVAIELEEPEPPRAGLGDERA